MSLQLLLEAMHHEGEHWSVDVGDDWMQGRSAFGGLQVAIAVEAMRRSLATGLPLRCLQVAFVAPVPAGPVAVEVQRLRQGASVLHASARLMVGNEPACMVTGIFGKARPSSVRIDAPPRPEARAAEASPELPSVDGVTPRFTRYLRFRWADGDLPYSGGRQNRTSVWLQLRDASEVDEAGVLALADAIPTPALGMLTQPAPASSLTWTVDFLRDDWERNPAGEWRIDTEVTAGADGYLSQSGTLYDPQGRAVLLSRQVVVIFG